MLTLQSVEFCWFILYFNMFSIWHIFAYYINYFGRHVHLDEPGRTDWEGFVTGTQTAAAGMLMFTFALP